MTLRSKFRTRLAVACGLLVAVGLFAAVILAMCAQEDPLERQVVEIIRQAQGNNETSQAANELAKLGPKTVPILSRLIGWQETPYSRAYEKLRVKLPVSVRRHLRDPRERLALRDEAVEVVQVLGPAAARPTTTALGRVLNDPAQNYNDLESRIAALRSLYWSLPESPIAVSALTNWLTDPARGYGFGIANAAELFPQTPEIVNLLVPWLRDEQVVGEVANLLASRGTNAAPAIPSLIQVSDLGVAQPPVKSEFVIGSLPGSDRIAGNRCTGVWALGKIGLVAPEVLAALSRAITNATNASMRQLAVGALLELRQPLPKPFVNFLPEPTTKFTNEIRSTVGWITTLGTNGLPALPWLRQFASLDFDKSLLGEAPGSSDLPGSAADLRRSAIFAMCQLDPAESANYAPEFAAGLVEYVGNKWEPIELSLVATPSAPKIVAALEPKLADTNIYFGLLAAHAILVLQPDHAGAIGLLRNTVSRGEVRPRLSASFFLWKQSGDGAQLLSTCIEALQKRGDQGAIKALGELGREARPAIPVLKAALWDTNDEFVRKGAGEVLRKIAPEELPPVR